MAELKARNSFIVVDLIEIKIKKKSGLLDNTGKEYADLAKFEEHPFQGEVILAPDYYLNGGQKYDCDIKKGDRVILPGNAPKTALVVIKGEIYNYIRYSDVIYSYTPDPVKPSENKKKTKTKK